MLTNDGVLRFARMLAEHSPILVFIAIAAVLTFALGAFVAGMVLAASPLGHAAAERSRGLHITAEELKVALRPFEKIRAAVGDWLGNGITSSVATLNAVTGLAACSGGTGDAPAPVGPPPGPQPRAT